MGAVAGERCRRSGIGRRLVTALLKRASQAGRPATVNAGPGSAVFWETVGFVSDERDGHTPEFAGLWKEMTEVRRSVEGATW